MKRKLALLLGFLPVLGIFALVLWVTRPNPKGVDGDTTERDTRPIILGEKDWQECSPKELGLTWVEETTDPKTGFVIGGKNATTLVQSLTELNGHSIADLERRMRPGKEPIRVMRDKESEDFVPSSAGFLGWSDKLLNILAEDNRYVVDELGLSHQELARTLLRLLAVGRKLGSDMGHPKDFVYAGRRFRIEILGTKGEQESPFLDNSWASEEVVLHNLTVGKKLTFSPLVPLMIERYGFYEGHGTRYRVEPSKALAVLDFLMGKLKR